MSEHTSKQFDHEIEIVRARALRMSAPVDAQTLRTLQALTTAS